MFLGAPPCDRPVICIRGIMKTNIKTIVGCQVVTMCDLQLPTSMAGHISRFHYIRSICFFTNNVCLFVSMCFSVAVDQPSCLVR